MLNSKIISLSQVLRILFTICLFAAASSINAQTCTLNPFIYWLTSTPINLGYYQAAGPQLILIGYGGDCFVPAATASASWIVGVSPPTAFEAPEGGNDGTNFGTLTNPYNVSRTATFSWWGYTWTIIQAANPSGVPPPPPQCNLSISTSSLPNGPANSVYPSQTLTATGGTPPLTWSVLGLPTGLVANAQTGVISGTPTQSGQASVAVQVTDSLGCTASKALPLTIVDCPAKASNVFPFAAYKSTKGFPTAMRATFSPSTANGPISLAEAANDCDVDGFDWQQTVTHMPSQFTDATGASLTPDFYDPPENGWLYMVKAPVLYSEFLPPQQTYPFYYNPALVSTGCAIGACILRITSANGQGQDLNFFDSPALINLSMPPGEYFGFTTSLVGVLPFNAVQTFFTWSWTSTYSQLTNNGGVQTQTASSLPVDGSGTGGITITSINGVTQTPPAATCTATPNTLWPPNGQLVPVIVSGNITAGISALTATTYAVSDEYGQVQPSGTITLGAAGSFSFSVPLISARNGYDLDGRTYTIYVTGSDQIGNVGACSAVVTVPHDQGQ
jgi:hypothetical protein